MKCFNHNLVEAVAVCNQCGKALCKECTCDMGHSITCGRACSDKASINHALVMNARNTYSNQKRNQLFMPALFAFMGGVLLWTSLWRGMEWNSGVLMGLGFLVFGVIAFVITRRWAKNIET